MEVDDETTSQFDDEITFARHIIRNANNFMLLPLDNSTVAQLNDDIRSHCINTSTFINSLRHILAEQKSPNKYSAIQSDDFASILQLGDETPNSNYNEDGSDGEPIIIDDEIDQEGILAGTSFEQEKKPKDTFKEPKEKPKESKKKSKDLKSKITKEKTIKSKVKKPTKASNENDEEQIDEVPKLSKKKTVRIVEEPETQEDSVHPINEVKETVQPALVGSPNVEKNKISVTTVPPEKSIKTDSAETILKRTYTSNISPMYRSSDLDVMNPPWATSPDEKTPSNTSNIQSSNVPASTPESSTISLPVSAPNETIKESAGKEKKDVTNTRDLSFWINLRENQITKRHVTSFEDLDPELVITGWKEKTLPDLQMLRKKVDEESFPEWNMEFLAFLEKYRFVALASTKTANTTPFHGLENKFLSEHVLPYLFPELEECKHPISRKYYGNIKKSKLGINLSRIQKSSKIPPLSDLVTEDKIKVWLEKARRSYSLFANKLNFSEVHAISTCVAHYSNGEYSKTLKIWRQHPNLHSALNNGAAIFRKLLKTYVKKGSKTFEDKSTDDKESKPDNESYRVDKKTVDNNKKRPSESGPLESKTIKKVTLERPKEFKEFPTGPLDDSPKKKESIIPSTASVASSWLTVHADQPELIKKLDFKTFNEDEVMQGWSKKIGPKLLPIMDELDSLEEGNGFIEWAFKFLRELESHHLTTVLKHDINRMPENRITPLHEAEDTFLFERVFKSAFPDFKLTEYASSYDYWEAVKTKMCPDYSNLKNVFKAKLNSASIDTFKSKEKLEDWLNTLDMYYYALNNGPLYGKQHILINEFMKYCPPRYYSEVDNWVSKPYFVIIKKIVDAMNKGDNIMSKSANEIPIASHTKKVENPKNVPGVAQASIAIDTTSDDNSAAGSKLAAEKKDRSLLGLNKLVIDTSIFNPAITVPASNIVSGTVASNKNVNNIRSIDSSSAPLSFNTGVTVEKSLFPEKQVVKQKPLILNTGKPGPLVINTGSISDDDTNTTVKKDILKGVVSSIGNTNHTANKNGTVTDTRTVKQFELNTSSFPSNDDTAKSNISTLPTKPLGSRYTNHPQDNDSTVPGEIKQPIPTKPTITNAPATACRDIPTPPKVSRYDPTSTFKTSTIPYSNTFKFKQAPSPLRARSPQATSVPIIPQPPNFNAITSSTEPEKSMMEIKSPKQNPTTLNSSNLSISSITPPTKNAPLNSVPTTTKPSTTESQAPNTSEDPITSNSTLTVGQYPRQPVIEISERVIPTDSKPLAPVTMDTTVTGGASSYTTGMSVSMQGPVPSTTAIAGSPSLTKPDTSSTEIPNTTSSHKQAVQVTSTTSPSISHVTISPNKRAEQAIALPKGPAASMHDPKLPRHTQAIASTKTEYSPIKTDSSLQPSSSSKNKLVINTHDL